MKGAIAEISFLIFYLWLSNNNNDADYNKIAVVTTIIEIVELVVIIITGVY